jgi:hypothetical protein
MQVMRLLVSQQLDHKTASLLLYALQTASTNLRMTKFDPRRHEVILDPRDVANTPLNSQLWSDRDFEEEQTEEETAADRAIAALEAARKKKEEDAKWMRWAEMQYPDPRKKSPAAAVTATAVIEAKIQPEAKTKSEARTQPEPEIKPVAKSSIALEPETSGPPRKPASSLSRGEIREQISQQIRKEFLPGYESPGGPKPTG